MVKEFQITYAKKGIFKKVNNIPKLVLHEGQTIKGKNGNITNFSFERSDFPLIKLETNTTTYIKTQELSSKDLVKCFLQIGINQNENLSTNIENCLPKNLNNILKELYKRFFIPLYIPLLMTLPLLLLITSKENLNYSRVKVFTFCFGLLVIIFSETSIRLISNWSINISLILHANSIPDGPAPTMNNFSLDKVFCDFFKKEFNLFKSLKSLKK